jgi:hypothetical protein
MTDFGKLAEDLVAAKLEATKAAAAVDDGGSCNFDNVRLFGVRWSRQLYELLKAADVTGRRALWSGRACVELSFGHFGQGAKNTAAVEAAAKLLGQRGWRAFVFYLVD